MDRTLTVKRRLILGGLALLLAGDLALGAYSWHTANTLRRPLGQLQGDARKLELLRIDLQNADKIRKNLPTTLADCDRFEASLLPATSGDSAITAELDDLAKKSGLQIQSLAFRHKEIGGRNLAQVEVDVAVNGPYGSVVKFMNGLQRSKNPYAVDTVMLQSGGSQSAPNELHIALHMKTLFRAAA